MCGIISYYLQFLEYKREYFNSRHNQITCLHLYYFIAKQIDFPFHFDFYFIFGNKDSLTLLSSFSMKSEMFFSLLLAANHKNVHRKNEWKKKKNVEFQMDFVLSALIKLLLMVQTKRRWAITASLHVALQHVKCVCVFHMFSYAKKEK